MNTLSVLLWFLAIIGLAAVFAFTYVRHALRAARKELELFRKRPQCRIIEHKQIHRAERKFFDAYIRELEALGFKELVTFENVTQSAAGRRTFESVWVSERDGALAELSSVLLPRMLEVFPIPLPCPQLSGKIIRSVVFVSPLSSGKRIITTSSFEWFSQDASGSEDKAAAGCFPPHWSVQFLSRNPEISEVLGAHRLQLHAQLIEKGVRVDLPATAEEYLDYSWETRRILANRNAIELEQLEHESGAGMFIGGE